MLKRILQSENFSISISSDVTDTVLVDFIESSNTLILSIKCFVDEAWVLLPKLATGLSGAAWHTISAKLGHVAYAAVLKNMTSILHQDYIEWSAAFNSVFLSADEHDKQGYAEDLEKMLSCQRRVKDWHPRLQQISPDYCLEFANKIKKDDESKYPNLISYTFSNDQENKLYAPRQTQPYYTDATCHSLMFHIYPETSSNVDLLFLFIVTYQKAYEFRLENKSKLAAITQNLLIVAMTDAYSSSIKQSFFPRYCEAATKVMKLADNYCGEINTSLVKPGSM